MIDLSSLFEPGGFDSKSNDQLHYQHSFHWCSRRRLIHTGPCSDDSGILERYHYDYECNHFYKNQLQEQVSWLVVQRLPQLACLKAFKTVSCVTSGQCKLHCWHFASHRSWTHGVVLSKESQAFKSQSWLGPWLTQRTTYCCFSSYDLRDSSDRDQACSSPVLATSEYQLRHQSFSYGLYF